jgi:hypothetical protein
MEFTIPEANAKNTTKYTILATVIYFDFEESIQVSLLIILIIKFTAYLDEH